FLLLVLSLFFDELFLTGYKIPALSIAFELRYLLYLQH
ncbi:hypothetical protein LINPERHAP2_LOCUS41458, partial [Linum perenne]